jgi:uncharacterized membrane protein YbhN (UPF0104 family)
VFRDIKIRKSFGALIKVIVFIGICYALYIQLAKITLTDFEDLHVSSWLYFLGALLLVILNWGIELIKWTIIIKPISKEHSSPTLIKSLFAGIATGIITPNRLGNFIGRMLYFKGRKRILAALGTLYANLAQFLATLIFGAIGFYSVGEQLIGTENYYLLKAVLISVLCLSFFLYIIFAFGPEIFKFMYRKYQNTVDVLQEQLKHVSFILLLLSLLRYLVFISQFGLLLLAFEATYSEDLISALYLHFLIISIMPSLFMGKLVIRETVALVILGTFIPNNAIIVVSSLTLWMINLGVPSLIGLYFILKKRIINVG